VNKVYPINIGVLTNLEVSLFGRDGLEIAADNIKFPAEEVRIHHDLGPKLATQNRAMLDLRTTFFCDYSAEGATGVPSEMRDLIRQTC
jgi:hypothetical protein